MVVGCVVRRGRRGISLLEVLISMFVLSIGLLGIASLMPVGKFSVREATKANQSAAAARAALSTLKVRGYLDPNVWVNYNGENFSNAPNAWPDPYDQGVQLRNPLDGGNSVCLDPLFIAANQGTLFNPPANVQDLRRFPFRIDDDPNWNGTPPTAPPRMTRVSLPLAWDYTMSPPALLPAADQLRVADRIFTWQADKVFFRPDDRTLRPDALLLESNGTPMRYQNQGQYSWLATIAPAPAEGSIGELDQRRFYEVSVVVFYQRNLDAPEFDRNNATDGLPSERVVYADFLNGTGLGGGDVRLWNPNLTNGGDPEDSDFPEVRPGQWIMLSGWVDEQPDKLNTQYVDANGNSDAFTHRAVYRWYRVVAAEDLVFENNFITGQDGWFQDVTLAGPDWVADSGPQPSPKQGRILDAVTGTNTEFPSAYATLLPGVVGVYTKTMMIENWLNR